MHIITHTYICGYIYQCANKRSRPETFKLEDGILVPAVSSCETLFNCPNCRPQPQRLNFLIYKMGMMIKAPLQ